MGMLHLKQIDVIRRVGQAPPAHVPVCHQGLYPWARGVGGGLEGLHSYPHVSEPGPRVCEPAWAVLPSEVH